MKRSLAHREWPAFLAALVLLSPVIYWTLDRWTPVVTIQFDITPPEVVAGGTLYRVVTVERKKICETDPDIVVIDAQKTRWRIDEGAVVTPGGLGIDSYKVPIPIPLGAAPGQAELRVTIARRCNPVQRLWPLVQVLPPIQFVILPASRQQP